jgi:hypothetical protein
VSNLFSVSDADHDAITSYRFWDGTTDAASGHFEFNGTPVAQTPQSFEVAAAQLSSLTYKAGMVADELWVRANDGFAWSDWHVFHA